MDTVVIFCGGDPVPADVLEDLPTDRFVIAADSGLDHAHALGVEVDLLVGDLDSVDPASLDAYPDVPTEKHPVDKEATDLEIALTAARRIDPVRVIIVGGEGGRLDHLLANAFLIASPAYRDLDIEWVVTPARVHVVHDAEFVHGTPGDLLSLLAVGGTARGVRTEGLHWQLDGEDLLAGSTRGVSNRLDRPVAKVAVADGTLLAILPGAKWDKPGL